MQVLNINLAISQLRIFQGGYNMTAPWSPKYASAISHWVTLYVPFPDIFVIFNFKQYFDAFCVLFYFVYIGQSKQAINSRELQLSYRPNS